MAPILETFAPTRRLLLTSGLATAVCLTSSSALARQPALSWLGYEKRLRARLADAGGGSFQTEFAHDLLAAGNAFRRSEGLSPFEWDEELAACARAQAADLVDRNYFAHNSPEGFTPSDRASLLARSLCGLITENLASRSYTGHGTQPRDFELLWEQSPSHRENLLQPATRAGYGVVRAGDAYFAAGVYADAAIRLAGPVPVRLSSGEALSPALREASPHIERLALTRPGEYPQQLAPPFSKAPALQPGLWQLRPMRAAGGNNYDVLSGPVILVG